MNWSYQVNCVCDYVYSANVYGKSFINGFSKYSSVICLLCFNIQRNLVDKFIKVRDVVHLMH